jgi:PAS domain S-box-containing protein
MLSREAIGSLARILIVEDERIIAGDLAHSLADLGYQIVGNVTTAEDAISYARERAPDLVLMDIRLAGAVDGVQAAVKIQDERDVPIIYLTAHADDKTLRRAQATGPFAYLVKPFKLSELLCAIELALRRHRMYDRMREREQWLTTTLHAIGDGLIATDAAENVRLLNPVAEMMTGWKREDALGRSLAEILNLVREDTHAPVESPLHRALQDKCVATLQDDALLVTRSGIEVPIDDIAAPILGNHGEILGGVTLFRDTSARRRSANDTRRSHAKRERDATERAERLEAANQDLVAFNYSVAHDLRTPLMGIDGVSQALIEDHSSALGVEGVASLQHVRDATQRMAQVIEDLLRLSSALKGECARRHVDLSQLVHLVASNMKALHPGRSVELIVEDDIQVEGDGQLLLIALENLMSNAWKFTATVPRARVEVGTFLKDGVQICFLRDNGVGFDMRLAHKLFDAFERLHSETDFKGTGVGLSIVQRIIQRHGGRIWAESTVGHGATFYFNV